MSEFDSATKEALFQHLLWLGDTQLVLGHRLSEWCGHGPFLEEDIALANVALDCIGAANNALTLAGELEGEGRSADDLAYFRDETGYRNFLLVEQQNGDFARTIARQFLFDTFAALYFKALKECSYEPLVAIAEKTAKEVRYHLRHSSEWVLRLGDGTAESQSRMRAGIEELWTFTEELFVVSDQERTLVAAGLIPDREKLRGAWEQQIAEVFSAATLEVPDSDRYMASGGQQGRHSEHLGYLLAEMQILQRSYPGCKW